MTFADILYRLSKLWWIVALILIISTALVYPRVSKNAHLASIGLGLQYNSSQLPVTTDLVEGYSISLQDFSLFLVNRFTSPEIQEVVANEAGLEVILNADEPFYKVMNQGSGFVSISHKLESEAAASDFINGIKRGYNQIVNEWNTDRLETFKINPQTTFTQVVTVQPASTQIKLLPIVTGLLVGLLVILLVPLKGKH
jgi:hypothetical protein